MRPSSWASARRGCGATTPRESARPKAAAPRPPAPPALCAPAIPANATPAERNAALAAAITCPSAGGFDFSRTGFGAKNQWTVGLQAPQNLFTGGRLQGQNAAADAQLRSANIEIAAQRAQM